MGARLHARLVRALYHSGSVEQLCATGALPGLSFGSKEHDPWLGPGSRRGAVLGIGLRSQGRYAWQIIKSVESHLVSDRRGGAVVMKLMFTGSDWFCGCLLW